MLTNGLFGYRDRALIAAVSRSQAIIEFDLDGNIQDANDEFLRMMGYALQDIRGKKHSIFVDPAESREPAYRTFWDELRHGRHKAAEFRRLAKGGREVWIQATYNPVFGRGGKPVGVVKLAADVTEAKLRAISDGAQVASIRKSQAVIHFRMDGTITDANDIFLQMMGYERADIIGKNHQLCVTPEYAAGDEYARFWEQLRRGEYHAAEFKRLGKDGREVWILATYTPVLGFDGKPKEVIKFATDVTHSKRRNADFEGQIDAINKSQAVIHFDLNGSILDANRNFLKTMDYQLAEIQGRHHSLFVDPYYACSVEYQEFWAKLKRGEFHSAVYKRIGKGGRVVWINATYNPILDLNGRPWKVVKYATDITARMEARSKAIGFAGQTLNNVQSVAAAVEQMSATAAQIIETMRKSRIVVQEITSQVSDANAATQRLTSAANAMNRVVQLIGEIASQINLLSLNATIESARAGEAGKGFAVVANEVKQLATQTTGATQQVAREIESMQTVTSDVVASLNAIGISVQSLLQLVGDAAASVEEQGSATLEISANMQSASTDVAGITRSLSTDGEIAA